MTPLPAQSKQSLPQMPQIGQDHDRLPEAGTFMPSIPPITTTAAATANTMAGGSDNDPVVEITAWQQMLSATSGSLLTGLLVTPLDVVRVRWQAQGLTQKPPSTATTSTQPPNFSKPATSTPNAFRPSNLGVTACCREVFFMNNVSDLCVASPRVSPAPSTGIGASGVGVRVGAACAVEETQQRTFNSTLDGLRKIARNEGLLTLWRGLSPTLVMAIPGNIIYFTGYEWLRFNPASPFQRLAVRDEYAPLAAGAAARTVAAIAVNPIELFRTRLQASHGETARGHVADTFHGLRELVQTNGYHSLWRGLSLTLWRDVPFSGMYWLGYETIRGKLTDLREGRRGRAPLGMNDSQSRGRARRQSQSRENHTETFVDSFVAGAASGAIASVATMPFDVGKTRTQVYRNAAPKAGATVAAAAAGGAARTLVPEEQSMMRLLWHIFSTEGVAGLFKGWIPRTLKVAPACAIMISSYEVGKRVFRRMNERALLRERDDEKREGR